MLKVIPRVLELRRHFEPCWSLSGQQWALIVNESCEFRTSPVLSLHKHTRAHTHTNTRTQRARSVHQTTHIFLWLQSKMALMTSEVDLPPSLVFFFPFSLSLFFYSCLIWEALFLPHPPCPWVFPMSGQTSNFKRLPTRSEESAENPLLQTIFISPTNWQILHTFDCITIKRHLELMLNMSSCTEFVTLKCLQRSTPNLSGPFKRMDKVKINIAHSN